MVAEENCRHCSQDVLMLYMLFVQNSLQVDIILILWDCLTKLLCRLTGWCGQSGIKKISLC